MGWGGMGDTLAHSVWDRDRNASCTDPCMDSRAARNSEGEGLVEGSFASAAKILEYLQKKTYPFSEFKKLNFMVSDILQICINYC